MTLLELAAATNGSPTRLQRALRNMTWRGFIRRHRFPGLDRYVAKTAEQLAEWFIPAARWDRNDDELVGTVKGGGMVISYINTVDDLLGEARKMCSGNWMTRGDLREIVKLFPEFTKLDGQGKP
jgi:DNA-binding transcriptional regulator GbsR (MarR family)